MECTDNLDEIAIKNFCDYLRIATVHPNPVFDTCITFLKDYASDLGLSYKILEFVANKPIFLMTWEGLDPQAPSILLNSHADVVPVTEENWTYPPFGADMDNEGNIYGRGAQDMKCVGVMYLEAIRRLIYKGVHFKRTFHLSFMPDEELGGREGMGKFTPSDEFDKLNVAFALDEGSPTPNNYYPLFYAENTCWQFEVHVPGEAGHGASSQTGTAGEKFRLILNKFMDYREKMAQLRESKKNEDPSTISVTSLNLTIISGGSVRNILPDKIVATFDFRISIYEDLDEFLNMIKGWCKLGGEDVTIHFLATEVKRPASDITDTNPFWKAMKMTAEKMCLDIRPVVTAGQSDMRYIRMKNIPCFGFTPINETAMRCHGDDEYINKDKLIEGIKIYMELFKNIGNL